MSLLRVGYVSLSWILTPLVSGYLTWRCYKGREEKGRLNERRGIASLPRPSKPLVWIHAVSVGEAITALTIMRAILRKHPHTQGLLTTTTVSSAAVIQTRLPKNIVHQYCPVDTPLAVGRFLTHWQPDLAIWIQSELWPNLLHRTQERGIPTVLLNGRISQKSFSSWKYAKSMLSPLLGRLALCGVPSQEQLSFFRELGATNISILEDVKIMMTPLAIDPQKFEDLKKAIKGRPLWVAASTHPGEETLVFEAHKALKKDFPNLLTILVPRHVERAASLVEQAKQKGLTVGLRTGMPILDQCEVYIADTLGEMGLFYAISPVVMMGATFVPKGGHNPIEAAQLGAFVLHGPHTSNNPQLYEMLKSLGLSKDIPEGLDLAPYIRPWVGKPKETYAEPKSLATYREEGLKKLTSLLSPYLKFLGKEDR